MAAFRFEGFNPSGKREKGFIHADDLREATEKLRNRSFFITDIKEVAEKEKWKALSPKEVLLFTKELARLLEAGLPLFDSLITLEEKYRKHSCHPIIVTLCDSIKHGSSFSEALRKHPLSFDPLYLSMIENAEKTGSLVMALHELARLSSRSLNLKKQLLGSLLYPFLLLTFCFAILATLIFYVIPSLSDLFEGRRVHPLTGFILSISKALSSHVEIFIFSLLGL
ncbi:MAG TPA: type II secretion system F family protein, partial [Chlamydiales bacterium]|nr:type II secretion system F family protein [Chlamydiales bacterium]